MDDRTVKALATGVAWLVAVLALRWVLRRLFERYELRLAKGDPAEAARLRTTFSVLIRLIVAVVATIGIWSVLSIFPQTTALAKAMLASSAVIALFAGLAFSTPLSNLGSGLLVAFSHPLRLGDRVTIGEHTGFVEEMSLIYTTLVTDEERRVFIPNSQLTGTPIVNRTIRDPRRAVSASFPVRLDAPLDEAQSTVRSALTALEGTIGEPRVLVGDPTSGVVWLNSVVYAPLDADVQQLGSVMRASCLQALGTKDLLPRAAAS
jgi:small conductance mechanosensitive channel